MASHKTIEYLPSSIVELQKELVYHHPTLCRVLKLIEDDADRFAAIATHCNVKLDGDYSAAQIAYVADQLLPRLRDLREVQ